MRWKKSKGKTLELKGLFSWLGLSLYQQLSWLHPICTALNSSCPALSLPSHPKLSHGSQAHGSQALSLPLCSQLSSHTRKHPAGGSLVTGGSLTTYISGTKKRREWVFPRYQLSTGFIGSIRPQHQGLSHHFQNATGLRELWGDGWPHTTALSSGISADFQPPVTFRSQHIRFLLFCNPYLSSLFSFVCCPFVFQIFMH